MYILPSFGGRATARYRATPQAGLVSDYGVITHKPSTLAKPLRCGTISCSRLGKS